MIIYFQIQKFYCKACISFFFIVGLPAEGAAEISDPNSISKKSNDHLFSNSKILLQSMHILVLL